MKTIVFANQKGGTGKTTTVISVGDAFARLGKRVLIADLDPQGHAAVSLNLDAEPCVANWLMYPLFNNQPQNPGLIWKMRKHELNKYELNHYQQSFLYIGSSKRRRLGLESGSTSPQDWKQHSIIA